LFSFIVAENRNNNYDQKTFFPKIFAELLAELWQYTLTEIINFSEKTVRLITEKP